jgi:hypothetical protein
VTVRVLFSTPPPDTKGGHRLSASCSVLLTDTVNTSCLRSESQSDSSLMEVIGLIDFNQDIV